MHQNDGMVRKQHTGLRRASKRIVMAIVLSSILSALGCGGEKEPALAPTATVSGMPTGTATLEPVLTSTSGPETIVYIVKPGDTLSDIADQFGTTVEAIVQANDIKDPDSIKEGQELLIPRR